MATKDEIKKQLDDAGIEYADDASVAELKALLPKKEEAGEDILTPRVQAIKPQQGDYSWAVNKVKLNRAIAYVRTLVPAPKGAEFDAAVKERYIETKGLLMEEVRKGGMGSRPLNSRVENVSPNDED